MISLESKLRIAKKARLRFDERTKGWLLVYPERGLALSQTAADILQCCDGDRTVSEVIDELGRKYSQPSEGALTRDVLAFLNAMADRALVEDAV